MAFENEGFNATAEAGTENEGFNQGSNESEDSSAQQSNNAQYEQQYGQLQSEVEKMRRQNQDLLRDLTAHKEELARDRETKRRALLQMSGDQDFLKEEAQKKRASVLASELKELAKYDPELQRFLGNDQQGQGLGDKVFYNTATQKAHDLAGTIGFETAQGKELLSLLGNILILSVPEWNKSFYKDGNMGVIDQVFDYVKTQILEPRDKIVENKIIERIRKQGRAAPPLPRGTAGSNVSVQQNQQINTRDVNSMRERFLALATKHIEDGYE